MSRLYENLNYLDSISDLYSNLNFSTSTYHLNLIIFVCEARTIMSADDMPMNILYYNLSKHVKGDMQATAKEYFSIVDEMMSRKGTKYEWLKQFSQCKRDFDRVCYLLRLFEESNTEKKGIAVLGLPTTREELCEANEKRDDLAELFIKKSRSYMEDKDCRNALRFATYAVFYARSEKTKGTALLSRSYVLFGMKYFRDAIQDAMEALKIQSSPEITMMAHNNLGHCFRLSNQPSIALSHFKKAKAAFATVDSNEVEMLVPENEKDIADCIEAMKGPQLAEPEPKWKCYYPEPPESLTSAPAEKKKATTAIGKKKNKCADSTSNTSSLLSANNSVLRLKNTNSERGWSLEVTRDVSVGEVLLTERPYASVLLDSRTSNCYHCYKLCYTLLPCSGCPFVGFCSKECATRATSLGESRTTGPGLHVFECDGVLPFLLLSSYAGWSNDNQEPTGNAQHSHLAYRCIANTDPNTLIDFICRTKRYKKRGRGHQAFVDSAEVRKIPPLEFDPSDYSSVAWLGAYTEKRSSAELWQTTVAAVFLTYCLSIAGYPMNWFGEAKKRFYEYPKSSDRPERLPASWVAACMLYHLQALTTIPLNYLICRSPTLKMRPTYVIRPAVAIFPTYSLINHSCNPSTERVCTAHGSMFVYALSPLAAGEEISICYTDYYYLAKTSERNSFLQKICYFKCDCEACEGEWYQRVQHRLEMLKCPKCQFLSGNAGRHCPKCRSPDVIAKYHAFMKMDFNKLADKLDTEHWTPEGLRPFTGIWEEVQDLVQPPGSLLTHYHIAYTLLIARTRGNLIIEKMSNKEEK